MKRVARELLDWYAHAGRAALPWRRTRDPYHVLVSEFMLQQTQVDRVAPKFEAFIVRFPSFEALDRASAADVLRAWKGLGYNSRAIRLKQIAQSVCAQYGGALPSTTAALLALPGIGAYTASAVRAFAFDLDDVALDTNVRRVTHRIAFGLELPKPRPQAEVDATARAMLPHGRAHDWNSALMDLGATVCTARAPRCEGCPVASACAAAPVDRAGLERLRKERPAKRSAQTALPFEQTTRFARGRIVDRLRELPAGAAISLLDLRRELKTVLPEHSLAGVERTVEALRRDGIVRRDGESIALTD